MADAGDHAYSYALAVLVDPRQAEQVATAAVRRGGRSVTLALAHAHALATLAAAPHEPTPIDPDAAPPEELGRLATALTASRPPTERALIDLDGRHGLDRVRLGRALGLSPDDAAARVGAVAADWQHHLDPALLAHLGPGSCHDLAAALVARGAWVFDEPVSPAPAERPVAEPGGTGTAGVTLDLEAPAPSVRPGPGFTIGALLAAAEPVGAHAATCAVCSDRLRALVSVRDLVSAVPLARAPASVGHAERSTRQRPPAFPDAAESANEGVPRRILALAVVAVLLLVAGVVAATSVRSNDGAQQARVASIAQVPAGGSGLEVRPVVLRTNPLPPVVLRNESSQVIRWQAETGATWLTAAPSEGSLEPGRGTTVTLVIGDDAPEGELRTAVTIVGDNGSTTAVRLETSVEHAPDVAAVLTGCAVTTAVEDESGVARVELHWRVQDDTRFASAPMAASPTGWTATLPTDRRTLTWWVTAADARGNVTRSDDQPLPGGACLSGG